MHGSSISFPFIIGSPFPLLSSLYHPVSTLDLLAPRVYDYSQVCPYLSLSTRVLDEARARPAHRKLLRLLLLLLLLLLSRFSRVRLCVTSQTAVHQAPPSPISRQEHWSGLPFPSPRHESEKWKWSRSVVSDSKRPHGLQPTRLLCPWDFPGKSTGVGCHCLLRWKAPKGI